MLKRVLLVALALVLLAMGATLAGFAGWLWITFGTSGVAARDFGTITPTPGSSAIVIDVDRIDSSIPGLPIVGVTELVARSDDASALFMGAASTGVVDGYLFGTHYSAAALQSGQWRVVDVPGPQPLGEPNAPWSVQTTGNPAVLATTLPGSVVIRSVDAPQVPAVTLALQVRLPDTTAYLAISAGAAALMMACALVLLWIAIWIMRRRGAHE